MTRAEHGVRTGAVSTRAVAASALELPPPAVTLELGVPGPPPMPIVGPLGNVARFVLDPLGHAERLFWRYGRMACLARGASTWLVSTEANPPGTVLFYGAELNHQVFSQAATYHKSSLTGPLYPQGQVGARRRPLTRMFAGLFGVNDDAHRTHRRLLLPAFHRSRVEGYRDDMVAIVEAVLAGFAPGQERDLWLDMNELTLRVATRTLFGADLGARAALLGRKLQRWLELFKYAGAGALDLPGLPYWRWLNVTHELDRDMRWIIAQKRRGAGDRRDILAALLEAKDEQGVALSEDELIGHASVLFAAGHETSSNALSWTLAVLSQHPSIAADLHDELWSKLRGDAPSVQQLGELPLLDGVVKESMRLLPSVPLNHRIVAADCELDGHTLPRNTELISSVYHTHRVPEVYAEPQSFLPTRWETLDPGPYAYSPFGGGPRMCIGASFALMEIKLVLAILLQRFRLALPANARVDRSISITMRPWPSLRMSVHAQDREFTAGARGVRGDLARMVDLPASP
jgi:cytochrome P450